MQNENILEVKNLSVELNGHKILEDLNFSVKRGEVLAIVGPNGAGKTVLFRALLGLISHSGEINWLPGLRVGYVPQKLAIEKGFPLTTREFLRMKLGSLSEESEKEIFDALAAVGINTGPAQEHHLEHHILNRPINLLSGGEFQRILIAWSLIGKPGVLLFDEPTTGIDSGGEGTIYNLLKKLQESTELSILLISHDLNMVSRYTDNVLCLNKKQFCLGKPKEILDQDKLSSVYGGGAKFFQHEHIEHL